jgi:hypothetical protein
MGPKIKCPTLVIMADISAITSNMDDTLANPIV